MSRRARRTASLVLLALFVRPDRAEACSCGFSGPPCQAFWTTDAVLDVTVTGIETVKAPRIHPDVEPSDEYLVKVDVRQTWKDGRTGPSEIVTNTQSSACGFRFDIGKRYLVFAWKRPFDGRWAASTCSLTREYDGTGEAAAFLGSLTAPPAGGRIFGTVKAHERNLAVDQISERAVETRVRLIGGGVEHVVASRAGRYEFPALAAGSYRVELDLPQGYSNYSPGRDVTLPNARACVQEDYYLWPGGRITGRVVGPDGRPLSELRIEVTHRDARPNAMYGVLKESATTDADGYFDVPRLGPGPYLLGVNLDDLPSQYNPYARTLYPSEGPDPHVLTLALGQTIDVGTWRLPPPLRVVRLDGAITWNDGTPASSIWVNAWDRTGNPVTRARGAGVGRSDERGHFAIDLREGRVYTFTARDGRGAGQPISAATILTTGPLEPIRIVIQRERPGDR